jgi:hypothetical protein
MTGMTVPLFCHDAEALRADYRSGSRCFCCFSTKLSADEIAFSMEIGPVGGSAIGKTARMPAVLPLFLRFFATAAQELPAAPLPPDPVGNV